jgi:hypothetical protein
MPPACGSCCGRRPPALAEEPGICSARLVPIPRLRPSTSRPCPRPRAGSPGTVRPVRRYRARRLTSPGSTVSSPRRRASASTSCETARVIAETATIRVDANRHVQSGMVHPHVRFSHRVPPPHPRPSRVDRRPDGRHMGRRIAPRLDRLARTTTHRPSCRPSATPPAHRRETHRANARRRVVSGTLRPPEHAGRARRHGTRIERSSPCVS